MSVRTVVNARIATGQWEDACKALVELTEGLDAQKGATPGFKRGKIGDNIRIGQEGGVADMMGVYAHLEGDVTSIVNSRLAHSPWPFGEIQVFTEPI